VQERSVIISPIAAGVGEMCAIMAAQDKERLSLLKILDAVSA
jgi:hypothetical protein